MNDDPELRRKIERLADTSETYVDGARVIEDASVRGILEAIDDTVLTARLAFSTNDTSVEMVAAGRRLQGIVAASNNLDGAMALIGKVLQNDEASDLQAVHAVLETFCASDGQMAVKSMPSEKMGDASDAGVTVTTLASAWDIDLTAEPPGPVDRFLARTDEIVLAFATLENETTEGDGEALNLLKGVLEQQRSSIEALRSDSNPSLSCFTGVLGDALSLGMIATTEKSVIFAYKNVDLQQIYAAWQQSS